MIKITRTISIGENEISEEFIRASGPGGQNVNKVATAVQLRFDVRRSPSLPEDVRERLTALAGNRMNDDGVLMIEARRFRTQEQNRKDALERLIDFIRKASAKPKPRHKTKPSFASKQRRIDGKVRRSRLKRTRHPVSGSDD
jgi:ribosome-associated protein